MFRFFCFLLIISSSVSLAHGAARISNIEMARELVEIIKTRASIEMTGGGDSTFKLLSEKYFHDLDAFATRYAAPFRVFALRPTIDRSLSYRLRIQQYSLSCEIAALRIILEHLGVVVTEDDIFASIPQFPAAYSSGGIWGDPDIEFVGSYTGGQSKRTGYGIYESPLADYARSYSLRTEIINQAAYTGAMNPEIHLTQLIQKLDNPNMHILLWGDYCTDTNYEDGVLSQGGRGLSRFFPLPARNYCVRSADNRIISWRTPVGKEMVGLSGEHAFVLLGYIGSPSRPSHLIVWDTYTGRHIYPISEWMRKWSLIQYRSLIISQ